MAGDLNINLPDASEETQSFFRRVLGPFADAGDLLSDKIRFYRWKSSIETLKKANRIAKENGFEPKEVPLKLLVPMLESASVEESDSELIDKWANLLATASLDDKYIEGYYIKILSSLSKKEVEVLESEISESFVKTMQSTMEEINSENMGLYLFASSAGCAPNFFQSISSATKSKEKKDYYSDILQIVSDLKGDQLAYPLIEAGVDFIPFEGDDVYVGEKKYRENMSLDILISNNLLVRKEYRHSFQFGSAYISILVPTQMGVDFVKCCRGDKIKAENK